MGSDPNRRGRAIHPVDIRMAVGHERTVSHCDGFVLGVVGYRKQWSKCCEGPGGQKREEVGDEG